MNQWVQDNDVCVYTVFGDMEYSLGMSYNEATLTLLQELGIDILISMYCTRGRNFSAPDFKAEMTQLKFSPLEGHKFYSMLNKWRALSAAHAASPLSESSSSSSSSSESRSKAV